MTLLLTESDVAACLDMPSLIPLMRDTLARFSRGECVQPVRNSLTVRPAGGVFAAAAGPIHGAGGRRARPQHGGVLSR